MKDKIKLTQEELDVYSYYTDESRFSTICDLIVESDSRDKAYILLALVNQKLLKVISENEMISHLSLIYQNEAMVVGFNMHIMSSNGGPTHQVSNLFLSGSYMVMHNNNLVFNYGMYNKMSAGYTTFVCDSYPNTTPINRASELLEIEVVLNKHLDFLDKQFKFKKLKKLGKNSSYNNNTMNKNDNLLKSLFGTTMFLRVDSTYLEYQKLQKNLLSSLDRLNLQSITSSHTDIKSKGFKV